MQFFWGLLRLSTRMFKARTSRTLLTVFGMGVGIGAILLLVSLGYGLQKTLLEKITTSDTLTTLDVSESGDNKVFLTKNAVEEIKEIKGVELASPAFQTTAQGEIEGILADVQAIGAKPSFLSLSGAVIVAGRAMNDENEMVISSALADAMNKNPEELLGKEVGMTYYLNRNEENDEISEEEVEIMKSNEKFTVVGVVKNDSGLIYVNLDKFANLGLERYSQLKVKCLTDKDMLSVRNEILEKGFLVSSISEAVDQANQVFTVIKIILMLFGVIALIVSAIGMFNTMTIALFERTEEIGIMKSIGASDFVISAMFVMEATIMGFLGGFLGIFMGFLGGKIMGLGINIIAERFGGESVDLFYSPLWFILLILVFSGAVGFFTGIIPARRASKIDSLDALRYK